MIMGVRWFFSVVYLWWLSLCIVFCSLFIPTTWAQKGFTACDICNCTSKLSPWKIINCSLEDDKVLQFDQRNIIIPANVTEIYIFGGGEVNFAHKTFNLLPSLELIHIDGTKKIVLEKKSFIDITAPSLLIQIRNCDELTIKTGAFDSVQGAVSTEIENVKHIIIEPSSFSKLSHSLFRNVGHLELKERAFDITNQIISAHGAVTEIVFDNVNITELPHETFYKALASVLIKNSNIGIIHTETFKATEISSVTFHNTNIDEIYERSFKDGTFIARLEISKCNISKLHPRSIMVALNNFTLNHSIIRDIKSRAIDLTVANLVVIDNQITNIESMGFILNKSNKIIVDDNIIDRVEANFIKTYSSDITKFSFKGNELHRVNAAAMSFLNEIDQNHMLLNDNSFWQLCDCAMEDWVQQITNASNSDNQVNQFMDTSYCTINNLLGQCFTLKPGIINMRNFTNNKCQNFTECKVIEATVNEIDTSRNNTTFLPTDDTAKQNWLIFIISIVGLFILGIVITFIVLLVRGSRWLKEKGYFRNNMHYNNNDLSTEEEGTIVTVDEMEKLEIPEELTVEFLQMLAERLDDPATNQEATEMVVRLYEMFIVDDSYENNNRQDEEAHLYEELGNLNLQIPPPPYEEQQQHQPPQVQDNNQAAGSTNSVVVAATAAPRNILRMMEEKFHQDLLLPPPSSSSTNNVKSTSNMTHPALVSEYSEPTDAAVHLYSELKGKSNVIDNNNANAAVAGLEKNTHTKIMGNGSLRSCSSNNTFNRPLPSKPNSKTLLLDEAGPSSKL